MPYGTEWRILEFIPIWKRWWVGVPPARIICMQSPVRIISFCRGIPDPGKDTPDGGLEGHSGY